MKLLTDFLRRLMGPSADSLMEAFHVRLLYDWIVAPDESYVHPQCTWILDAEHPLAGTYEGQRFYDFYIRQMDSAYPVWHEVVKEVIGSRIGGIVVGEYQFRRRANGLWYSSPFTHFYRIHEGRIISVRYYRGDVRIHFKASRPLIDLPSIPIFLSSN